MHGVVWIWPIHLEAADWCCEGSERWMIFPGCHHLQDEFLGFCIFFQNIREASRFHRSSLETLDMTDECLVHFETVLCICGLLCPAMCNKANNFWVVKAFHCRWPAQAEVCEITLAFFENAKWANSMKVCPRHHVRKTLYTNCDCERPSLYICSADFRVLLWTSISVRIRNKTVRFDTFTLLPDSCYIQLFGLTLTSASGLKLSLKFFNTIISLCLLPFYLVISWGNL